MKTKQKTCKGNYRSGHFKGCGELKYIKMYGLCASCFVEWCKNTQLGSEWITKSLIPKVKKDVKAKKRKEFQQKKKELNKGKAMNTADMYFSRYIRTLYSDNGYVSCFTCGDVLEVKEIDNGHYQKRAHQGTRYHEDNCRPQCKKKCNGDTAGNGRQDVFRVNLVKQIGEERVLEIERLANEVIKVDSYYFEQKSKEYREKLKELEAKKGVKYW